MTIINYPSAEEVEKAIAADEPMLMLVSFDGGEIIVSQIDEAVEHHILLAKVDRKQTEIDRYFRVVFDKDGADWTFVCPPDYKNISRKDVRIRSFYRDGFTAIAAALESLGYFVGINIPTRYRRHFDMM